MTTLYIPEPGALLKADQTNFHVFPNRSFSYQVAIAKVEEIVLFGYTNISQEALKLVRSLNISLLFLEQEKPYHSSGQATIKHQQRQLQYCRNHEFTWETTESILRASCHNRSHVLKGLLGGVGNRKQGISDVDSTGNGGKELRKALSSVEKAVRILKKIEDNLPLVKGFHTFTKLEEKADEIYFIALDSLLPPDWLKTYYQDEVSQQLACLLNLGYIFLGDKIRTCLEKVGLDPNIGNFHNDVEYTLPLVADLMLELGAIFVDYFVVQLTSNHIINCSDFTLPDEEGEIHLYPLPLRKLIKAWEAKLDTPVKHLRVGKVTYRRCIELQVKEYLA